MIVRHPGEVANGGFRRLVGRRIVKHGVHLILKHRDIGGFRDV